MTDTSIEHARLDPQRLDAVRSTGILDSPTEESFDRLTRLAAKLTGAPVTFISLVDDTRDFYKSCFGLPEPLASERQVEGTTFCHYAMVSKGPLIIENAIEHPIYKDIPTVHSLGVRAYLGIPLINSAGQALGSFCAIDFKPRTWSALDVEVMQELAASTLREIELRSAIEIVQRERSLFDITLRQMPAGVMICDTEGRVILSNELAAQITGRTLTDLRTAASGRGYRSDGSVYDRDQWPLTRSIRDGETIHNEKIILQREDGQRLVLSVSASPVRDASGAIVAGVVTFHDMTALDEVASALKEEQSRLKTVLEQVPAGVLVAEAPSGKVIMGNRQAELILGHVLVATPEVAAYGQWSGYRRDGSQIAPEEWPLARALRGEIVRGEDVQYEPPDGRRVWIRIHGAPVLDGGGEIIGGIVAFYDVDEQRRVEIENARLFEEAKAANAAKDAFFAAVSHELRTPMTSIIGWSRILRMDVGDNPDVIEAAQMIESSAALQAQLVDDLLDVSRIATGKIHLAKEPLRVSEVVGEAVRAAQPAAATKGIRLRENLSDGAVVDGDRARLRQIFGNLLSNAVKFTPAGGLVEVAADRADGVVSIRVKDTGRGIGPELLPRVFERGLQAHNAELGGLGLGLTIVRHLVEMHGGDVRAESEGQGRGATFVVRLPAVEAVEA